MSLSVDITPIYTSSGCNTSPRCLDWGKNGLIAYGACNSVVLYKPEEEGSGKTFATLSKHQKLVTSVQWIKRLQNPEEELLSTSADHTAIIWSSESDKFIPKNVLAGHTNVVKIASAIYVEECSRKLLIATSSADSSVKIWNRDESKVECIQTLSFGNGFAIDIKLTALEQSVTHCLHLLAIARDDSKIHLYVQDTTGEFKLQVRLGGHEDWIQSVDLARDENNDLMIASGSQDTFIRIWRISTRSKIEECVENSSPILKLDNQYLHTLTGQEYKVSLETVLRGHDKWVYCVRWSNHHKDSNIPLQLLSVSMDKTMVVWQIDEDMEIWLDVVRVGDVGGEGLGLYGGAFSPNGDAVIGQGYQGSIHLWVSNMVLKCWTPKAVFSGHFNAVHDIAWEPEGTYILSCSDDQTTRLHAPLVKYDKKIWQELARPQVHGYDMVCLATIDRYRFVSGADEKILRCFEAPRSFAETLKNLCDIDTLEYMKQSLPEGASVPALGLSNKAIFEEDIEEPEKEHKFSKDKYTDSYYTPIVLNEPPRETLLLHNTLWPEEKKLYGHPYEVFAVAANHESTVIASACKASKVEHASIILWDVRTWRQLGNLEFHTLTITQLEFSPNDEYLLSVSRDRLWAVYQKSNDQELPYKLACHSNKKNGFHSRIIWSCSWSHDNSYFATASRDKKIVVWGKSENSKTDFVVSSIPYEVESSSTAVAFAPCLTQNQRYLIAIGMENGKILLCAWNTKFKSDDEWTQCYILDESLAHHLTVNRLKFSSSINQCLSIKKINTKEEKISLKLASCGSDHFVRIYNISICVSSLKI